MLRTCKKLQNIEHLRCIYTAKKYRSTASDPDLIQNSVLPTDYFQKSLPHLPIPKLEDTCRRYLKSQQALLSAADYTNTERIVNGFREDEGKVLNDELIARDKKNKQTSYISGPWFDMYLRDRRAICLNHNPFMAFNDDHRPEYNDQSIRATNYLVSSAKFMKTLRAGTLEPEVFHLNAQKSDTANFRRVMKMFPQSLAFYGAALLFKAYPLDMSQYSRLFNSTRIPRPEKDELYGNPNAKHVIVIRKGHFYTLDVLDSEGRVISPTEILAHVKQILADSAGPAEFPVAVMTSQHRDTWTELREDLVQSGNAEALDKIDTAMFALSLDDDNPDDPLSLSQSFLHGNGSNRWFDKSLSLLIAENGHTSVSMEHAWGDGVAVLRYLNDIFKHTIESPHVHPDTSPADTDGSAVKKLEFRLSDKAKQGITEALRNFKETVAGLGMDFMKHEKHNKNDIKGFKLSPDSFLQLAIQMGYYRVYGETVATYESCSTAAFRHGRTETIRSATSATKRTCEMFEKSGGALPSVTELQEVIRECSTVHGQLTKEAAMGQGFDRHLFGLRILAAEKGGSLPEMFTDPAYSKINHIILSTSTLSSPALLLGGFAPVVPNGFGVGYAVENTYLGCNVTAYKAHREIRPLVTAIEDSLVDMITVMKGTAHK